MNPIKYFSFFILLVLSSHIRAQDSQNTLSAKQVMDIVKQFHPVAKQADIFIERAKADVTIARGGFDPVLQNEIAQKTFDGTDYYYYSRPELSIPTWFGVEVSSGIEYLSGNRTNPVETKGETSFFGVSIPLAKNLLIDKRRAALQTAKILYNASSIEKRNTLNNLLVDALDAYWTWVQHYQVYKILTDAVIVNRKRVEFIKTAFQLGERPAIDTTEAVAQLQNFLLLQNQALLDFQNARLELSLFLWTVNTEPFNLQVGIIPEDKMPLSTFSSISIPEINDLLSAARKIHPELIIYDYKMSALNVERKLKFQELLPAINFRYNQLGKGYEFWKTSSSPLFENNFQYGLSLGIPLRLSQGRGEYRKTRLKIIETELQLIQKQLQVETKVRGYFNELTALKEQVVLQEKNLKNYQALQRAEEIKFQSGESSLFLINTRENKTLEAFQKLQELKIKYFKTEVSLQWSSGLLIQQ